jgi:hypothetical protein
MSDGGNLARSVQRRQAAERVGPAPYALPLRSQGARLAVAEAARAQEGRERSTYGLKALLPRTARSARAAAPPNGAREQRKPARGTAAGLPASGAARGFDSTLSY